MQSEETQPRHSIIRGRVDSTPCLSLVGLLIARKSEGVLTYSHD